MKIAIISNIANGVGLQVDYELIRDLLVRHGHEVVGISWLSTDAPKGFDVAIFLEVLPENFAKRSLPRARDQGRHGKVCAILGARRHIECLSGEDQ